MFKGLEVMSTYSYPACPSARLSDRAPPRTQEASASRLMSKGWGSRRLCFSKGERKEVEKNLKKYVHSRINNNYNKPDGASRCSR